MSKPGNSLTIVSPNVGQLVSPGKVKVTGKFAGKRPTYLCGALFQGDVVPTIVETTRGILLPEKRWQINIPGAVVGMNFVVIWALYRHDDHPVDRYGFFFAGKSRAKKYKLGANTITIIDPNGNVNVANHQKDADGDWNGAQPVSICGEIWNPALGQPPQAPPPMGTTAGNVVAGMSMGTWDIPNIPNVQCSQSGVMNALVVWSTYGDNSHSMAGTGFRVFC